MIDLKTIKTIFQNLIKNRGEIKSALVNLTTSCNARCVDRCEMWKQKSVDMSLEDLMIANDFLKRNGFLIEYFTGGEPALYPHIVDAVSNAKDLGLITSLTTNGTISARTLEKLSNSLDFISVSVDHYIPEKWDDLKHFKGISKKAVETIQRAKELGIGVYGLTFLGPELTKTGNIERMVHYVNDELGIPFALCYPFISESNTFLVGGKLHRYLQEDSCCIKKAVEKILQLKLSGSKILTPTAYMRDIIRAHEGLPMKYNCKAGLTVISLDYNLDVYPCFKKGKLFNIHENPSYHLNHETYCAYDNKYCLINCFKEPSLLFRKYMLSSIKEELFSNPISYLTLLL